MRLVVVLMSGLLAALVEPVKFTWRHLLTWLQGLITAGALKLALHQKEATLAAEAAEHRSATTSPGVSDIPGPTPLPFFGTRWIYNSLFGTYQLDKVHEAYSDLFRRFGPIFKEEALWNYPIVNICSAQDIEKIVRCPSKFPIRPPNSVVAYYKQKNPDKYINAGLVNEQGEVWHKLRTSLTHDLVNTKVVQGFIPAADAIVDDYLRCILKQRDAGTNQLSDIIDLNRKLGGECTSLMTLGERMGLLDGEADSKGQKLCDAMEQVFEASNEAFYGLPLWKIYPTASYKKYARAESYLYDLLGEYVDTAFESTTDYCQYEDVQSIMLGILRRPELDIKEKKSAMVDFIVSGIDSIGNSVSLMLYLLAMNPEAQEKLHQEIHGLLLPGEPVSAKFLQSAKYLRACVQETFRLLPAAPLVARVLDTDTSLSGHTVSAGTVVLCHLREACLDESNFVHPTKFIPERWIPSEVEADPSLHVKSPFLVSPFGFQRRSCPGKKFSEQTLQIFLAKVVQRFELRCDTELELRFNFLLSPAGQLCLQFRDRI